MRARRLTSRMRRCDSSHAGRKASSNEPLRCGAPVTSRARALRLIGDPAGAEEHLRVALKTVLDYQLVVEMAGVVAEQNRIKEAQGLIDAALGMAEGNPRLDPGEALLVRA